MFKIIIMMMILTIIPHVVAVVGSALVPMVLVTVGSQLLIHVNGSPANALMPIEILE